MSRYNKIKSEHSSDKYIVGGVAMVLIIVGLIAVWISTANPRNVSTVNATSTTSELASSTISMATTTVDNGSISVPGDLKTITLAKCLAQKKITMYGAYWCTHCKDQKDTFGSSFQYVPYIECPKNVQLCISKLVESYPTWLKSDGTKLEGFVKLDKLAEWAGCAF